MKANDLQTHVFLTYLSLRYGMALLAFIFPILLYTVGWYHDLPLQDSISHYYYATPCEFLSISCKDAGLVLFPDSKWIEPAFPMRVWFVGVLFAIGSCLFLYSGFSKRENSLLNFAGALAWFIAIYPMDKDPADSLWGLITVHGISTIALFVCMILVVWLCAKDTLYLLPKGKILEKYRKGYIKIGIFMGIFPLIALILTLVLRNFSAYAFIAETLGIWTFALYWFVKSRELSRTRAEMLALQAKITIN